MFPGSSRWNKNTANSTFKLPHFIYKKIDFNLSPCLLLRSRKFEEELMLQSGIIYDLFLLQSNTYFRHFGDTFSATEHLLSKTRNVIC